MSDGFWLRSFTWKTYLPFALPAAKGAIQPPFSNKLLVYSTRHFSKLRIIDHQNKTQKCGFSTLSMIWVKENIRIFSHLILYWLLNFWLLHFLKIMGNCFFSESLISLFNTLFTSWGKNEFCNYILQFLKPRFLDPLAEMKIAKDHGPSLCNFPKRSWHTLLASFLLGQ